MTSPEDERIAPPSEGGPDSPDETAPAYADGERDERSLFEDVETLIDDGRTYLEAEIAYQKTRAAFVADKAKSALVFGAVAAAFAVLALIGLTVGLILALTPWLTAWGASALVVGLLAVGALLAARTAGQRWKGLMAAIDTGKDAAP